MLDVEATFCYLGDMLCSGEGCDSAIAARVCVAWGQFEKLLPVLTTRHLYPGYTARCTRPAFTRLCSMVAKCGHQITMNCSCSATMTCWICGIRDRDETPSASRIQKFGIEVITSVLRCRRLRYYGHVQRATSCIKCITNFTIPSTRTKGRPRKTWSEFVKTVM